MAIMCQAGVAVANLAAGVLLARGLPMDQRGAAALLSVLADVGGLAGAAGLNELMIRTTVRVEISRPARLLSWAGAFVVAVVLALALAANHAGLGPVVLVGFAVLCVLSSRNALYLAAVFRRCGVAATGVISFGYALFSVALLSTLFVVGDGQIVLLAVVATWICADLVVTIACGWLLGRARRADVAVAIEPVQVIGARELLRSGLLHALSQVGSSLADRGVMLLALSGGYAATAQASVAQSMAAPVLLPVGALAAPIMAEACGATSKSYARISRAVSALICALGLFLIPRFAGTVFGEQYSPIGRHVWLLMAGAACLAFWKTGHLQLRGRRRPGYAATSNLCALAVAGMSLLLWLNLGSITSVLLLLAIYGAAGAVSVWAMNCLTDEPTQNSRLSAVFATGTGRLPRARRASGAAGVEPAPPADGVVAQR